MSISITNGSICSTTKKRARSSSMTLTACIVERRLAAFWLCRVHVCTSAQQERDDFCASSVRSHMQRSFATV